MNLYRYLNARHSKKQWAKIDKSLKEFRESKEKPRAKTWTSFKEMLDDLDRRLAERSWYEKSYHRVRRELFGMHGLFTYKANPRVVINRSVWRYQRSKRGWSDSDTWSFDSYIAKVMSEGLIYLADHTHSYPGDGTQWDTPEKWDAYLRDLAARLGKWDVDSWTDANAFNVTRDAIKEFGAHYGQFWD